MTRKQIEDLCERLEAEDVLLADGLDSAFIGLTDNYVAVYDRHKCMTAMMQQNDWTEDEAWEFLEFNTFTAHVGEKTPIYIHTYAEWIGNEL